MIQKVCHNTFGRNIHTVCVRFFLCICVREEEQLRGVYVCIELCKTLLFLLRRKNEFEITVALCFARCVYLCCVYLVHCVMLRHADERTRENNIAIASAIRRLL